MGVFRNYLDKLIGAPAQVGATDLSNYVAPEISVAADDGNIHLAASNNVNIDAEAGVLIAATGEGEQASLTASGIDGVVAITASGFDGVVNISADATVTTSAAIVMIGNSASALGFYEHAPVVLQTGVAVDAASIHAALVALGLITGP